MSALEHKYNGGGRVESLGFDPKAPQIPVAPLKKVPESTQDALLESGTTSTDQIDWFPHRIGYAPVYAQDSRSWPPHQVLSPTSPPYSGQVGSMTMPGQQFSAPNAGMYQTLVPIQVPPTLVPVIMDPPLVSNQVPARDGVGPEEARGYVQYVIRKWKKNRKIIPPSTKLTKKQKKRLTKKELRMHEEQKKQERMRNELEKGAKQELMRQSLADMLNLSQWLHGCRFRVVSQVEQQGWKEPGRRGPHEPGRRGPHVFRLVFKAQGTISVLCWMIVYFDTILGLHLAEVVIWETTKAAGSTQLKGFDVYFCFAADRHGANEAKYALDCVKENFGALFRGETAKIMLSAKQEGAQAFQKQMARTRTKNRLEIVKPDQGAQLDQASGEHYIGAAGCY